MKIADTDAQENLRSRLSILRDEYIALSSDTRQRSPDSCKVLDEIRGRLESQPSAMLSMDDVQQFARLLLEVMSDEQITYRVLALNAAIRDLRPRSGSPWYEDKVSNLSKLEPNERRVLAAELQREFARLRISINAGAHYRTKMLVVTGVWSAVSCILCFAIAALLVQGRTGLLWVFPYAAGLGAVGAWISVAARTKDVDELELGREVETLSSPGITVWVSPILGAIGALLAIGLLWSGVIEGSVVPDPNPLAKLGQITDMASIKVRGLEPVKSLFIISIVSLAAGWSERFVSDVLEWVSKKHVPTK